MAAKQQPEIYFHVGLGKTASTYLQYAFFPKLEDIHYVQRTQYRFYESILAKGEFDKYFFSREFDQQLEAEVSQFAKHYANTKPIIIFRRHDGWIASQYRRYIKNGSSRSFKAFLDLENDTGIWPIREVTFRPMLDILEKYFTEKPLVLFYEDLRKDPYLFFDQFANTMGANYDRNSISLKPVHPSYNSKQLKVMRSVAKYFFRQDPGWSKVRLFRWLQRRTRLLGCYLILYAALLIPDRWVNQDPLIDPAELEKVRRYFDADWQALKDYADAMKNEV